MIGNKIIAESIFFTTIINMSGMHFICLDGFNCFFLVICMYMQSDQMICRHFFHTYTEMSIIIFIMLPMRWWEFENIYCYGVFKCILIQLRFFFCPRNIVWIDAIYVIYLPIFIVCMEYYMVHMRCLYLFIFCLLSRVSFLYKYSHLCMCTVCKNLFPLLLA